MSELDDVIMSRVSDYRATKEQYPDFDDAYEHLTKMIDKALREQYPNSDVREQIVVMGLNNVVAHAEQAGISPTAWLYEEAQRCGYERVAA